MTLLTFSPTDFLNAYPFHTQFIAGGNLSRNPITLTRGFREHPRISGLNLWVAQANFQSTVNALYVGRLVTAMGLPMRISSVKAFEYPVHGYVRFEIELTGKHAQTGSMSDGFRCDLDTPQFVDPKLNPQGYLSLSELGTYTTERTFNQIPFPDATEDEFTTWREQAEKYENITRVFWDWNGTNPHAKTWVTGRPNHGEIQALYATPDKPQEVNLGGSGVFVGGVQLAKEMVNARFEINIEKPPENVEEIIPTNTDANIRAANLGLTNEHFAKAEQCFDRGGITVVEKYITKLNDTILSEVYYTWGFLYDTMQTHSMNQAEGKVWFNPVGFTYTSFWQIVKTETITYTFDINDNYCTGKTVAVSEYVRILEDPSTEDDNRRIRYMKHLEDNASNNIDYYNLMAFTLQSYTYTETIELESHQDYYADIPWKLTSTRKGVNDKFIKKRKYKGGFLLTAVDPDSIDNEPDADKRKKYYKGKIIYEEDETKVLVPGGRNQYQATPEKYLTSKLAYTIEGEDLARGQGNPETTENTGRPPVADRLVEYPNVSGGGVIPDVNNVYLFNSNGTGFGVNAPILETLSYDGIVLRSEAELIAEHILSIENTFACMTWSFSNVGNADLSWYPGDICTHNGYTCVIQSLEFQIAFNHELNSWELLDTQTSATIGKLVQPSVSQSVRFA